MKSAVGRCRFTFDEATRLWILKSFWISWPWSSCWPVTSPAELQIHGGIILNMDVYQRFLFRIWCFTNMTNQIKPTRGIHAIRDWMFSVMLTSWVRFLTNTAFNWSNCKRCCWRQVTSRTDMPTPTPLSFPTKAALMSSILQIPPQTIYTRVENRPTLLRRVWLKWQLV